MNDFLIYLFIYVTLILLLILYYRHYIFRRSQEKLRNYLQTLQIAQSRLEEQMKDAQKFRHDLKNHLQTMEYMAANASPTDSSKIVETCGDTLIDSILELKRATCIQSQIDFVLNADSITQNDWNHINEIDRSKLIHNLLDNAIEACIKIPDKKKRWIFLSIQCTSSDIIITVRNSCQTKTSVSFSTTKNDPQEHGFGSQIILNVAQKYKGYDTSCTNIEEQYFERRVTLPLTENNT